MKTYETNNSSTALLTSQFTQPSPRRAPVPGDFHQTAKALQSILKATDLSVEETKT